MNTKLEKIREKIDAVDEEICKLLNQRLELALRTSEHKNNVQDKTRERTIFDRLEKVSASCRRLNPEFLEQLFILILAESRKLQRENRSLKD